MMGRYGADQFFQAAVVCFKEPNGRRWLLSRLGDLFQSSAKTKKAMTGVFPSWPSKFT